MSQIIIIAAETNCLFSAARVGPPKIEPYFRCCSVATKTQPYSFLGRGPLSLSNRSSHSNPRCRDPKT
jgi:hypothetical protein